MARLANKVAIVTGGAGGIGLAAARCFVNEGARVLLVDRDEAALLAATRSIGSEAASHAVADVTRPEDVERFVQVAVDRYGGLDVFANNAGILGAVKPITEYPIDMFDAVLAVNVRGVWLGLKYAMPAMARRGGGSIIVTASTAGVRGSLGLSGYVASKHAAVGLMRVAALEGAPLGIRVNSVNPSPIETAMVHQLEEGIAPGAPAEGKALLASRSPLKRYGTPEEVAKLMLFLASDESSFCTGGVYMVDGGRTAM